MTNPDDEETPSNNESTGAGTGVNSDDSTDLLDLEEGDSLANFSNRNRKSVTEVRALNPGAIDSFGNILEGVTQLVVPK